MVAGDEGSSTTGGSSGENGGASGSPHKAPTAKKAGERLSKGGKKGEGTVRSAGQGRLVS